MLDNTDEIIICPACGKKMQKIYMPSQKVHLDVCVDGCGGIFFDNMELKLFDEEFEDITPLILLLENKKFEPTDSSQKRVCPCCGWEMVKNYSSANNTIEVDECYHCGGKFLDNSELEKIRAEYATEEERVADVMKKIYSAIGDEIDLFSQKYEKQMKHPSLLTKIVRWKSSL